MTDSVLQQIAGLKTLDHENLCNLWRTLYGKEPPAYSRPFLISRLSHRIQEIAYGGLSDATKQKMHDVLKSNGFNEVGSSRHGQQKAKQAQKNNMPVVGTKLVRDWNGRRYEVIAVSGGFEYDGRLYRSLSAIAKVITGTHWNGKLFFGCAKSGVGRARSIR
mgnify:CR=1 FL=1